MRVLAPHLTMTELIERLHACDRQTEAHRWRAVLMCAEGASLETVAASCGRTVDWARRTVARYNELGPAGMGDERKHNGKEKPSPSAN